MLEETAIYQVPLFERYPLWTEFDRRQKMIDAAAARDNQIISNHERAEELGSVVAIDPLVLRPETLTIAHAGEYNEAGELTGYRSTAQIGYFGDPELWSLSPLDLPALCRWGRSSVTSSSCVTLPPVKLKASACSMRNYIRYAPSSGCNENRWSTSIVCSSVML